MSEKISNSYELGSDLVPAHYDPALYRLRHSTAHLLAWATEQYFAAEGKVIMGVGPATQDGFFYDFILPRAMKEEDLLGIEDKMKALLKEPHVFSAEVLAEQEILAHFSNQPFKQEIIQGILDNSGPEKPKLTIFKVGGFSDLCRGPHVHSTEEMKADAFKLLSFSGSYWKGDNQRESCTRIHGVVFQTKEALEEFLWQRAEAEKRDHRKLGKQLELFHFDETAPGMPYWLPDGLTVFQELLSFCREEGKQYRYQEIATPLINKKTLWQTSGHWEHYHDDMYLVTTHDSDPKEIEWALKPMNCPNAMVVYNLKTRSYRDLPLRLSDCDSLHRNEVSGALHGLLRVRQFHQDDAHIFAREDQIESEFEHLLKMCESFYSKFNMKYTFRLSTRPESFMGEPAAWDRAEAALISILNKHVGEDNYTLAKGEGAFYGPKIDVLMQDNLKRVWQMGTMQLDFQLPSRFECQYVDEEGSYKTPVVIHRAIYGSLERFIGVLIEHTSGNLPLWLAPRQVIFVPIADRHIDFCTEQANAFLAQGIRASVDGRSERMNAKIRDAQLQKIPYILVVGDKEIENNSVSCRKWGQTDSEVMALSSFQERALNEIKLKSFD